MRKLFVLLLISLLAVFGAGSIVQAQDPAELVYCGTLAEADCNLLKQSATAMSSLSSASFDFNLQFSVNTAETGPIDFALNGVGSFTDAPTGLTATSMSNPAALAETLPGLLRQLKADLSLTLTLPQMLIDQMAASGATLPSTAQLDLRLVDGLGYVNFDSLKPVLDSVQPGLSEQFAGWGGIDLAALFEQALAENPQMLDEMTAGMTASMDADATAMLAAMQNGVTITRGSDVDGAATFDISLDFAALASDPAFIEAIRQQMEAQGQAIDEAEFQQGLEMLPAIGEAVAFTASQTVETATGFIRSTSFNLSVDTSKLPADMVSEADASSPAQINISGSINYADFNAAPAITAPEGAQIAPPEMLGMGAG